MDNREAESPFLHYPRDILYHAMAMPGCDSFSKDRGKSLYGTSFSGPPQGFKNDAKPNELQKGTPECVISKSGPTGNSLYRESFDATQRKNVQKPPPKGFYAAREAEKHAIGKNAFDSTSTARATYGDTKEFLREHDDVGRPTGRSMHDCTLSIERLPFTATSTSRASYTNLPDGWKPLDRRNPVREREVAEAAERAAPGIHSMCGCTSTMRGDIGSFQSVFEPETPDPGTSSDAVIPQRAPQTTKKSNHAPLPRVVPQRCAGKPLSRASPLSLVGGPSVEPMRSVSQSSYRPVAFRRGKR